jgi:predicted ArsR family transcriptional regulator
MLLTPPSADERVWHLVRESGSLRARADEVARQVGCDADDARHALDDLVQRNVLRRFDVPGDQPVYWS